MLDINVVIVVVGCVVLKNRRAHKLGLNFLFVSCQYRSGVFQLVTKLTRLLMLERVCNAVRSRVSVDDQCVVVLLFVNSVSVH